MADNIYQKLLKNIKNPIIKNVIVILLYAVIIIIFSYPLIFQLTTHIAGIGDTWQVLYIFWYTKSAIMTPSPNMTLDYTNYIFYPYGVNSVFIGSAFNQLLSIPLQQLLGLAFSYNILWLMSFVLGGYGTYLMVKYLTGNDIAAFFSGIVFAFSPYHFAHGMGHMGATTIEWIPFCALFLMKMFREKDLKYSIYAAIFFILVAMSDSQYMVYMGIFAGLLLVYEVVDLLRKNDIFKSGFHHILERIEPIKHIFLKYTIFAFISLIVVVPLNYYLLVTATSGDNYLKMPVSESIKYSADLLGFFIPSSLHPLFGDWLYTNVYQYFTGNPSEYTTFIGYTVLLLSIYAFIKMRNIREVKFWIISAIFFFIISLGPLLHIMGNTNFTDFNATVPLPYIILYYIVPFIDNGRTIARFDVMAMLSFAVLSGYAISGLRSSFKNSTLKNGLVVVLTLLLIFEFATTPVISKLDRPVFYDEIAKDKMDYALLEIPATFNYDMGVKCEYYQTIHGKKIVGGKVARTPQNVYDFENNTPFICSLTYLNNNSDDIFDQNITEIGSSVLQYYNIKYIVVHRDYLSDSQLQTVKGLLNSTSNVEAMEYEVDNMTVYHIENTTTKLFMIPQDGWWNLEKWGNNYTRWIKDNGTLFIYVPSTGEYNLSFASFSISNNSLLQVFINGQEVYENRMLQRFTTVEVPIQLNEGKNIIWFKSPEGSLRPCDIPELKSTDTRNLSIAFQDIRIS